jgi:hypothetical protein
MNEISLQNILFFLGPASGEPIWNILLYAIFVLALIALLLMPDKNMLSTLLIAGVLLAAVIAKLVLSSGPSGRRILAPTDFGMFILNIIPFVFPMLAIGVLRAKKKAKVVIPSILTAVLGFVYFFMFWLTEQSTL